jgi:single-stranded-DNA-specific exonuclease
VKNVYCVYRLDINEFRGNRTVQMLVEVLRAEES